MKWFKRGFKLLMVLIVLGVVAGVVVVNPLGPSPLNRYPRDGRLQVPGLSASVRVVRDSKGMAYIYAANTNDLLLAQGYVTAQDRLFQMELTKLFSAGRIGELAGQRARSLDLKMRTLGFHRQARRHVAKLNPETLRFVQKYVDGINAFIKTQSKSIHLEFKLAGIQPQPWTPVDALGIMYFMGWNSAANIKHEIVGQLLVETLGPEKAAQIFPLNRNPAEPYDNAQANLALPEAAPGIGMEKLRPLLDLLEYAPLAVGSNNWVVGPQRSKSGQPVLANDPHLEASTLPGPWYPSGLITPEIRAVGVTIPGTPGMVAGRTQHLAYGITNAYADAQDLYVETVDPENPDNYLEGNRSIPFVVLQEMFNFKDSKYPDGYSTETHAVRLTRRGPVISDVLWPQKTDKCISVRWSAFETMGSSVGFERFLSCRNSTEFRQALSDVNFIALNFVFADHQGQIGWQVGGRLPIRTTGDGRLPHWVRDGQDNWRGWIPFDAMPQAQNPPQGWIGTTNHKTVGADYPHYYSNYFASSYRQQRLVELMQDTAPQDAMAHWQFQRDTLNHKARKLSPIIARALIKHADTEDLGRFLMAWDGRDDPQAVGPTLFHSIFNELAQQVYTDELGPELTHLLLGNSYFWEERLTQMITKGQSDWYDDQRTPDRVESLEDLLHLTALAVADRLRPSLGDDPAAWKWGKLHRYDFISPIMREGLLKRWLGGGNYPAAGSGDTLCRTKFTYDDPSRVKVMASLRMVVDLGDPHKILAVLPGGVAGRQFDPHTTDQIASFIDGNPVYWWFSDQQIQTHQRHELILEP